MPGVGAAEGECGRRECGPVRGRGRRRRGAGRVLCDWHAGQQQRAGRHSRDHPPVPLAGAGTDRCAGPSRRVRRSAPRCARRGRPHAAGMPHGGCRCGLAACMHACSRRGRRWHACCNQAAHAACRLPPAARHALPCPAVPGPARLHGTARIPPITATSPAPPCRLPRVRAASCARSMPVCLPRLPGGVHVIPTCARSLRRASPRLLAATVARAALHHQVTRSPCHHIASPPSHAHNRDALFPVSRPRRHPPPAARCASAPAFTCLLGARCPAVSIPASHLRMPACSGPRCTISARPLLCPPAGLSSAPPSPRACPALRDPHHAHQGLGLSLCLSRWSLGQRAVPSDHRFAPSARWCRPR